MIKFHEVSRFLQSTKSLVQTIWVVFDLGVSILPVFENARSPPNCHGIITGIFCVLPSFPSRLFTAFAGPPVTTETTLSHGTSSIFFAIAHITLFHYMCAMIAGSHARPASRHRQYSRRNFARFVTSAEEIFRFQNESQS